MSNTYTITSGTGTFTAHGQSSAETYIRHLMNQGVSYSVEVNKTEEPADEYTRDSQGNIMDDPEDAQWHAEYGF